MQTFIESLTSSGGTFQETRIVSKHKSQNTSDFTQRLLFGCLTSRISKKTFFFFPSTNVLLILKEKNHCYVDIGKIGIMRKVFMNLLNGLAAPAFGLGCSHGGIKRHTLK